MKTTNGLWWSVSKSSEQFDEEHWELLEVIRLCFIFLGEPAPLAFRLFQDVETWWTSGRYPGDYASVYGPEDCNYAYPVEPCLLYMILYSL